MFGDALKKLKTKHFKIRKAKITELFQLYILNRILCGRKQHCAEFKILTLVVLKSTIFWDTMP
jgi:hypothetical protein